MGLLLISDPKGEINTHTISTIQQPCSVYVYQTSRPSAVVISVELYSKDHSKMNLLLGCYLFTLLALRINPSFMIGVLIHVR